MFNVYGLVQLNTIPSIKHGNIPDLVISNTPHLLSPVKECDLSFMSDHVIVTFSIHDSVKSSTVAYKYKCTDVDGLISDLNEFDILSAVQLATSVDDAWWEWFRLFSEAIDNNVPKYVVKDSWGPAWVDQELRQLQADKLKKTPQGYTY